MSRGKFPVNSCAAQSRVQAARGLTIASSEQHEQRQRAKAMTSLIVVQVRLSGLIVSPSHGHARRIASVATASTMASTTAMPAMKDHDSAGGSHGASQAGTEPFKDASSANHPNRETKPLMMSGPILSGSSRMPSVASARAMRSPSVRKTNAPR